MAKWFSFSQLNLDDISPKNSNFYTKKGGGGSQHHKDWKYLGEAESHVKNFA